MPGLMRGLTLIGALALCATCLAQSQQRRSLTVFWQGLDEFASARDEHAMESTVRRPATAGGEPRPAIFLHPIDREPTTLTFPPASFEAPEAMRVFFVAWAGLADGVKWDDREHTPDGVRFAVRVNGAEVARTRLAESRWEPLVADLGGLSAGQRRHFTVELVTDAGEAGDSSYDWANFGEPMLVAAEATHLAPMRPQIGTSGMVIADAAEGGATIVVEALDAAGEPIPDEAISNARAEAGLLAVRFDFGEVPGCEGWRVRVAEGRAETMWGGAFGPRLMLTGIGPARAVNLAGEQVLLRAGVKNAGLGAVLPIDRATVTCTGHDRAIDHLAPGDETAVEFQMPPRAAGACPVSCEVRDVAGHVGRATASIHVWPALPELPREAPGPLEARELGSGYVLLANGLLRWLVQTRVPGLGALVWARRDGSWHPVGSVAPLVELLEPGGAEGRLRIERVSARADTPARLTARGEWLSPSGGAVDVTVRLVLPAGVEAARVRVEARARRPMLLGALRGPALHVGDRTTGAGKGMAVFPGLEFLYGDEPSSSTRDLAPPLNVRTVPHRFKVTVPMMMTQTEPDGPCMALIWDPRRRWDGERMAPAAGFASPNFIEHQDNHLMQLFLPSVPDFVPENARVAAGDAAAEELYEMQPDRPLVLDQWVVAGWPEPDATGAFAWFDSLVGFPPPEGWPRSFADEMALCRHGFMETVWDADSQQSLHVVGGGSANAPGFAALMLMDARAVASESARRRLLDRVGLIAEKTVREAGPEGLASGAMCHIMRGELPYHWGHMPQALRGIRDQARSSLERQEEDRGWGFHPDERRSALGERGTRTIGICAREALTLARWAAISGDPETVAAMERALRYMRRFHVPRGAQGWE
ncbi:MAG: hypothetical protein ACP5KN_12625, partial [Armatimonadota bacterium]